MDNTVAELTAALRLRRGHLYKIAIGAGVNYFTLLKIANGKTANPGALTCEKLWKYLRKSRGKA